MATSFISTVLTPDNRDLAMASWYCLGMLGCDEEPCDKENVRIRVYFADTESTRAAELELSRQFPLAPIEGGVVENQDWNARWRESMKPARLARRYWVSPLWLSPPLKEGDVWIKIEPKMAFGTGHHETTRLAARGIIAQMRRRTCRKVLDIGTGSGVLCFVAESRGATHCVGIELDCDCRENLAENLQLNLPQGKIEFIIGQPDCLLVKPFFDLVVMNMIMTESAPQLRLCAQLLGRHGRLVWSGILVDEKDTAAALAQKAGFRLIKETVEHEWWCGTFEAGFSCLMHVQG